jgi:hypothetical protein
MTGEGGFGIKLFLPFVFASAAKQSLGLQERGLLRRFTPRNDKPQTFSPPCLDLR